MADFNTMRHFANEITPPREPVEDYITEVGTRCALFDELRALCKQHIRTPVHETVMNATVSAAFMIAPISEHRDYLQAPAILGAYVPKSRSPEASARPPFGAIPTVILNEPGMDVPSGSVTRSGFSKRVKDRDGHICVFSGMSDPEAGHIFPFATSRNKNLQHLNELLKEFEDASITHHQIHFLFDNTRFPLKPLRETPEGVVVQWHWLKRSILKPLTYIHSDSNILHQAGVMAQSWGDNLAHRESGTFLLRADKPEDKPSWDLLEMRWHLLRVAAICGAAGVTGKYYGYDGPDERALKSHELGHL
ncbi:hypothetical protein B0H66DRAFT_582299 [Apodospora peruviana]|uniref:HNH nuclease domain-containing protein n=1 Tax=Apodospora peruviana TaxID=516989 RepID=A0AAE0I577_9PEZI|nr:hypothetical protein B0H66DRAFT_582299 [Apodospora peruviana]